MKTAYNTLMPVALPKRGNTAGYIYKCEHGPAEIATCGNCGRSWCAACDPAPAALCHYCHGIGYSIAPRKQA